ncbi:uncharacterized protein LOC132624111 [Lycium barbarum]|uniref:uncharacterized protein LOC132624111 n=1 Tax=Lycium barbarum TaxID=112863 RepID=UPI00293ED373|nr:uncharacterized protein LOC132624111 [Lycium barbarum]
MANDCSKFVQKCHKCQIHEDLIKVPPTELNAMTSHSAWGMDVLGTIEPAASNKHSFILVAIDYFTKWFEAASYASVTKKVVAEFPQMNRAVEAANKNIKKILKKIIDNYKDWHEQLPYELLGYRTTARTSTEATPYLLVYGTEAVILAEVEIPSLRIIQEAELDDAE